MGAVLLFGYVMLVGIIHTVRPKNRIASGKIAYYGTIGLVAFAMAIGLIANTLGS